MDNDLARQQQQLNAKVPWALAVGAKRLAQERGVPLNEFLAQLIAKELLGDADVLRARIREEEEAMELERKTFMAELERIEKENETKAAKAAKPSAAGSPGRN